MELNVVIFFYNLGPAAPVYWHKICSVTGVAGVAGEYKVIKDTDQE